MTTTSKVFDLICIGAGPCGLTAAVSAAKNGLKVACVDSLPFVGGCCVNIGCIPTKALAFATHQLDLVKQSSAYGVIGVGNEPRMDLSLLSKLKDDARDQHRVELQQVALNQGVEFYMNHNCHFLTNDSVSIENGDDKMTLQAKSFLIATGARTMELPFLHFDEKTVFSSTGLIESTHVPLSLAVIGSGAVGLELGSVWHRMGSDVTFIECMPSIGGPFCDKEAAEKMQAQLEHQGIHFKMNHMLVGAEKLDAGGIKLMVKNNNLESKPIEEMQFEQVLVSIGRCPNTDGLGLDEIGVERTRRKHIVVNDNLESTIPGIFAAGDVVEGAAVAHKATLEAIHVVDHLSGKNTHPVPYDSLPCCVYTAPELAYAGKPEYMLRNEGIDVKSYIFDYNSDMRNPLCPELTGFVKVVCEAKTDVILSINAIGESAGDLLDGAIVCIRNKLPISEWGHTPHVHPFYKSFHTMLALGACKVLETSK